MAGHVTSSKNLANLVFQTASHLTYSQNLAFQMDGHHWEQILYQKEKQWPQIHHHWFINSPFVHAGLRLCASKTTMGGIACPLAFAQPIFVTCPFLPETCMISKLLGAFLGNYIWRFRIKRSFTLIYIENCNGLSTRCAPSTSPQILILCLLIYCVDLHMSTCCSVRFGWHSRNLRHHLSQIFLL